MQPSTMWIQTYTGKAVDLLDPQPDQFCFEDIAFALSRIFRYTGHMPTPISVACHSRYVADILADEGHPVSVQWAGIAHDWTEAYIGDISAPMKRAVKALHMEALARLAPANPEGFATFPTFADPVTQIERRIWAAICERWPLPVELPEAVRIADLRACAGEKRDLGMAESPRPWGLPYEGPPVHAPVVEQYGSAFDIQYFFRIHCARLAAELGFQL